MNIFLLFTVPFLVCLSYYDIKCRSLPLPPLLVFGGGMLLAHLILNDMPILQHLKPFLLSACILLLSRLTHESIGEGDALAVLSCALAAGTKSEIQALIIALFISAAAAAFLLIYGSN